MNQLDTLLLFLYRKSIVAPDADTGLAQLAAETATDKDWRTTIAEATAASLIHDPVRLAAGALQCHWRLDLTPHGFEAARKLLSSGVSP